MKKTIMIATAILAVSAAFGQSEEKAIKSMATAQAAAATHNDLAGYMATIDPQCAGYAQTKKTMSTIFNNYKLKYKVESFKVVSVSGNKAVIKVAITTTKISGPAFRDNRVKMTETVIKKGGKWLTNGSKMDGIEYLN